MEWSVIGITFLSIFLVELPDKTFVAALVLATKFRPLPVWIGVGLAFFVQTLIAVLLGKVVTFLPHDVVQAVAMAMFLIGAVILFRQAPNADAEASQAQAEQEYGSSTSETKTGLAAIAASFVVLFAAEWGDLSQLLTITFVGRYHQPLEVFIGAWVALLTVSGLAALIGRVLLRYMKLSVIHYFGAAICLILAILTLVELVK